MNKLSFIPIISGAVFSIAAASFSQQALADYIFFSESSSVDGDYFIRARNLNEISDFSSGSFDAGVYFDGNSFATPNSSSGLGAGTALLDIGIEGHEARGSGGAYADVSDPLNQLSFIQIDGEASAGLRFSVVTPHTYTLTGSLFANEFGSANLFFDSTTLSEADGAFSLSGTLEPGNYALLFEAISALDSPGNATASFDFELQLQDVTAVPLPAAFWLFASGLIGMAGMAKHKRCISRNLNQFSGAGRSWLEEGAGKVLSHLWRSLPCVDIKYLRNLSCVSLSTDL